MFRPGKNCSSLHFTLHFFISFFISSFHHFTESVSQMSILYPHFPGTYGYFEANFFSTLLYILQFKCDYNSWTKDHMFPAKLHIFINISVNSWIAFKPSQSRVNFSRWLQQGVTAICFLSKTAHFRQYLCNGYGFLVGLLSYRTLRFDSGESMHTRNSLRGIYFLMIFYLVQTAKTKVKTELVKVFYKTNVSILNLE